MVAVAVFRSVLRRPTVTNRSNKCISEHQWQWKSPWRYQAVSCNASKADKATTSRAKASVGHIHLFESCRSAIT